MQTKVEICGVNTSKLKVLKNEEAMELIEKAHKGDREARDKLVMGNLRLVLSVVQKFSNRGELMDDLFQIGVIGLIKAIDNFDTSQNVRFSTYACPMIIGELRRYLRDNGHIRISRSMKDTAYKAMTARERLMGELQREPTPEEISEAIGVKKEDVVFSLEAVSDPISLFEPVYQEGGDSLCLMDQIRDDGCSDEAWIEKMSIREAMQKLSEREKRILAMRFYDGKTQMEVSREIGISQAQVSRLEKGALGKIKGR